MAAPDHELRRIIGKASARLNIGMGQARIISDLQQEFPSVDEAKILHGIDIATQYYQGARRIRRLLSQPEGPKKFPRAFQLSEFLPEGAQTETASVHIYWEATLQNGRVYQGSSVVNVDPSANITTIVARFGQALCQGHIRGPNQTYQCRSATLSVKGIAGYSRPTAVLDLDTAPITRAHPNPYRPRNP